MKKTYLEPDSSVEEIEFESVCGTIESGGVYSGGDIDSKERDTFIIKDDPFDTKDSFDWQNGIW